MFLNKETVDKACGFVSSNLRGIPAAGIIAGSGLGGVSGALDDRFEIPYDIISGFPNPSVRGHDGKMVTGLLSGVPAVVMCGRVHYYEGHDMQDVVFPVMLLHALGARTLVVMSAAGGISEGLVPGSVMVVEDHINMMGANPLRNRGGDKGSDEVFVDMTGAYDPVLSDAAVESGGKRGLACRKGVLAAMPGPVYETPAEVRMLGVLGADAVCMSMVPEVIAARYLGMRVLGLAVITNRAAGLSGEGPSHEEVLGAASGVSDRIAGVLEDLAGRFQP